MVSQKILMWAIFGTMGIVGLMVIASIAGVNIGASLGLGSLQAGQVQPGTTSTTIPASQTFFDASTGVQLRVEARETIPDSTGLKNRIDTSVGVYNEGSTTPFDTIQATSAGFIAGTNRANVGSKIWVLSTNTTSSYHAKSDLLTVPSSASYDITLYQDRLNTLTVTGQNSTSGTWAATSMGQTVTTDEAKTLYIRLEGATARGVYRAPAVCFNYNTANFSSCEVTNAGATELTGSLAGVASGYEECWTTGLESVTHYDSAQIGFRCTPVSGVNPNDTVTLRVVDYGTYVKQTGEVLFNGYQNEDTLADVGATNYDFVVGYW